MKIGIWLPPQKSKNKEVCGYQFWGVKNVGGPLLQHFGNSLTAMLRHFYPDYPWIYWNFQRVSDGFWDDPQNMKDFILNVEKKLNITNLEEWYDITEQQVLNVGNKLPWKHHEQLVDILSMVHEGSVWDVERFKGVKKTQNWLALVTRDLFPGLGKNK